MISTIGFCWLKKYRKTNSKSKESTQKITAEDKALTTEVKNEKEDSSINQPAKASDVQVEEKNEEANKENPNDETWAINDINKIENALDEQIATIIKGYEIDIFNEYSNRNSKIEKLQEICQMTKNIYPKNSVAARILTLNKF